MPRPPKCRRISDRPAITVFKPAGVPGRDLPTVELGFDELEAIRLADLEGLYHEAAADEMGISRPTFGRLVERARRKVATALFQGSVLQFEGGSYIMDEMRVFECADCGTTFQVGRGGGRPEECPGCHGHNFHRSGGGRGAGRGAGSGGGPGGQRARCRRRGAWSRAPVATIIDSPPRSADPSGKEEGQ